MTNRGFKSNDYYTFIGAMLCLLVLVTACKNQNTKQIAEKNTDSVIEPQKVDKQSNTLFKFNNVIFSIPSPYEFAYFVKNLGITYKKEYVNPSINVSSYTSSFKKAINLGVYGTDLGYLTINEQTPDAVSYFSTIKSLSNDLGIASVFGKKTMDRIEKNMNNKDSLMFILSTSYRESDAYLKDNDRRATAALILAGSWIESQYILTQLAKSMPVKEVYQRVAEQKHPLDNLIKILSIYYNKDNSDYVAMTQQLVELAYEYDGIDYIYEYKKPIHNAKNSFTIIQSVSELQINAEQIKAITKITEKLRLGITKK
jgi:hypothetical protein